MPMDMKVVPDINTGLSGLRTPELMAEPHQGFGFTPAPHEAGGVLQLNRNPKCNLCILGAGK